MLGAASLPVIPDDTVLVHSPQGKGVRYQITKNADTRKLKEAKEVGRRCYNEFTAEGKETIIEYTPCDEYWRVAKTKNYPAPFKEGYTWHGRDTIRFDTPSGELEEGHYYIEDKDYRSLLEPKKAQAAIAFDATTNGGVGSIVCSDTWSHTTASGSNLFMIGGSTVEDSTLGERTVDANGFTYNGDVLTLTESADSSDNKAEIFYLINPDVGTFTVSITWCTSGSALSAIGGVVTYSGVDQTSPINGENNGTFTNDSTPSLDITTTIGNAWVFALVASNVGSSCVLTADQTNRWSTGGASATGAGEDTGPKTPAGTQTMSWTGGLGCSGIDGSIAGTSFIPVADAPASSIEWYIDIE